MYFLSQQQLFQNFPTDLSLNLFVTHLQSSLELWQKNKVPTLTGFAVHKQLVAVAIYAVKGNLQ